MVYLGSVWGPIVFNVFIIDWEKPVDTKLVKAVEGTKLFHLVNTTEICGEFKMDFFPVS